VRQQVYSVQAIIEELMVEDTPQIMVCASSHFAEWFLKCSAARFEPGLFLFVVILAVT
jgi:hypothetical protein